MRIRMNGMDRKSIPLLGLALSLVGCLGDPGESRPSQELDEAAYVDEVKSFKQTKGIDYEKANLEAQARYGIRPLTLLPENRSDSARQAGLDLRQEVPGTGRSGPALPKQAGILRSGSYTAQQVYIHRFELNQGETMELTMSGGSAGVDPVAVLFRYGNQTHDFAATGIYDNEAQHINTIYAYNDDYSGLLPKITYTVPPGQGGYFEIMIFTYSTTSKGTANVNLQIFNGGSLISSAYTSGIAITGHPVRYTGPSIAPAYLTASPASGSSIDPWAMFWDFGNMVGADNDNSSSGVGSSWVANTSYFPASTSQHYLNCMLFTSRGLGISGAATWSHYN